MRFQSPLPWLSAATAAAVFSNTQLAAAQDPIIRTNDEVLQEALLKDIMKSYSGWEAEPSECSASANEASTIFTFDFPGTNAASKWYTAFEKYEEGKFAGMMSHVDTSDNNRKIWTIRIGTGGDMYSHFVHDPTDDTQGTETMPANKHTDSPWNDEVTQMVSVNNNLNLKESTPYCDVKSNDDAVCKKYFIHQAGDYQRDGAYTKTVPFYSPLLAKHCSGNSCIFASWGGQAHVPTPFTSPVIYITKYTNCGDGLFMHTQMMHNFAPEQNTETTQNYFNTPWGGVRTSTFPYALEPVPTTGDLRYSDVNNVRYLKICPWGTDGPNDHGGLGQRIDLKQTGGYTTFVSKDLKTNRNIAPMTPACRKPGANCYANDGTCMVTSCTDAQVLNEGYVRIQLKVDPRSTPGCREHGRAATNMAGLKCNLRGKGFGENSINKSFSESCAPEGNIGFRNRRTGEVLHVNYIRHWSHSPNDKLVFFSVFHKDAGDAIAEVHDILDNSDSDEELLIDVVMARGVQTTQNPPNYDPDSAPAFTYIYGNGKDYIPTSMGNGRRRIGISQRDYTVMTINWWQSGATLAAGTTYINRAYMLASTLGEATNLAKPFVDKVYIDKIALNEWNPRHVNIYVLNNRFVPVAASNEQGESTTCSNDNAVKQCTGTSTPQANARAVFYVTCGSEKYLGFDPYAFTPSFGASFPEHGPSKTNFVRPYVCDGQATDGSVRATWKLIGFFDEASFSCESNEWTLDDEVCPPEGTTARPTMGPTISAQPTSKKVDVASVTDGSITLANADISNLNQGERAALVDVLESTIEQFSCTTLSHESCEAKVMSLTPQTPSTEVIYKVMIEATCSDAGCSNAEGDAYGGVVRDNLENAFASTDFIDFLNLEIDQKSLQTQVKSIIQGAIQGATSSGEFLPLKTLVLSHLEPPGQLDPRISFRSEL